MRRVITILVLFALTLYSSSAAAYWLCYIAAADAIAATYCVNRADPCCRGKCHVAKTAEQERNTDSPAATVLTMKLLPFILFAAEHSLTPAPIRMWFLLPAFMPLEGTSPVIDHPPSAPLAGPF